MTCSVSDCQTVAVARGLCRKHYARWWKHGDPLILKQRRARGTPYERWLAKVDKAGECWQWLGATDRQGYGQFDVIIDGKHLNARAHRWGYQRLVRELGAAETLDHLCRNRACVNPDHLEPVAHAVNVARGDAGRRYSDRTHCANGHEFTPANTAWRGNGRVCKECRRAWSREAQRQKRGTSPDAVPNGEKTHCGKGHEFTPENTIHPKRGGRACRECSRAAVRDYMRRRRAKPE